VNMPMVRRLWSSLRTARELKNRLTTIPACVMVRASRYRGTPGVKWLKPRTAAKDPANSPAARRAPQGRRA